MPNAPTGAVISRAIHPAAVALIKEAEGCKLKAYLCPAGVLTIGYGHTAGVTKGQSITATQAEAYLTADLAEAATQVDRLVKVPLTETQRGALASFVFNLGAGSLQRSTLLVKLNAGDHQGAADQFRVWINVNGKPSSGLIKRRAAEAELFRSA